MFDFSNNNRFTNDYYTLYRPGENMLKPGMLKEQLKTLAAHKGDIFYLFDMDKLWQRHWKLRERGSDESLKSCYKLSSESNETAKENKKGTFEERSGKLLINSIKLFLILRLFICFYSRTDAF